ncbi:MAG: Dabb family protein [Pirellulales bacterium]|nr:Dabb family protein [Pirellulales bacterium]
MSTIAPSHTIVARGKMAGRAMLLHFRVRVSSHMPLVKHFGVFEFKPEVSGPQIDDCFRQMRGMAGKIPGLMDVIHGPYQSLEGLNDGFTHGFIMRFESAAARDSYLPHPEHERVKRIVVPCLKRVIVFDFEVEA